MKRVLLLAHKDFLRKWRNPVVIVGFMLMPLVFSFLFGVIFGREEETALPRISVLAVDKDKSLVSQLFLTALSQGELEKLISLKTVEETQGREMMEKGKASALLIIPEKFGQEIWDRRAAEIRLLKNPAEQFLPQVVEEIADTAALLFSSLLSVFGDELDLIKGYVEKKEFTDQEVALFSQKIKKRIEGVSRYVFPPVISLRQETIRAERKESPMSVQSYTLPAMALMFLLFVCNVVFEDIIREREMGTLLRMSLSPLETAEFVWSKILVSMAVGMLCTATLIILGKIIFGIFWGDWLTVLFIVLTVNVFVAGFISIFYSFVRTERQAGAVMSSVFIVMSLLGGSMIPVENFPAAVQRISRLTVNYWGIQAFYKAMNGRRFYEMAPHLLGLITAGLVLSLVGSSLINRKLRRGLFK
jgi:ABC-2 type transport system permease protein